MKIVYIEIGLMVLLIILLIYFHIQERKDERAMMAVLKEINDKTVKPK